MDRPFFSKTLLVEDQALTRQAMKTLLLQCEPRLQVDEAADYAACIALLGSRGYDLLFLDYQLGKAGCGLGVLHWIAAEEIAVHTVMLSGQDDRETIMECIKAGACGFISKVSDAGDSVFRIALDTILNGQIYLPYTALGRGGYSPAQPVTHAASAAHAANTAERLALSPRLAETLGYICQGLSNKAIARQMGLSENTVKEYSSTLLEKFGTRRRTELIVEMARRGVVMPRR